MQFNSYIFIFCFLPITLVIYFLSNRVRPILGKLVLILASIIFFSWGRPHMIVCLGISICINFLFAQIISKVNQKIKRIIVVLPIMVNVGLLVYFKYLNFFIDNINIFWGNDIKLKEIILPLGISFYTFQQMAYIVAIERGELNNNIIDYLTYILYFPKLVMGPIVDPIDFINQINHNKKIVDLQNITYGIKIFSFGLLKKVLLADTFAKGVSWVYENIDIATSMDCILLILFYSFEIYFDFSGYSDMAVGISSMFNIALPINFDSPYKAISIRDFWKRWHISLTQFLTKYIYIPLGGSHKGILRTCMNTLLVFFISGLWHGANWTFILWGLIHGVLSCADRLFDKIEDKIFVPLRWMVTMFFVGLLWLLFSAQSVGQWWGILLKIVTMQDMSISDGVMRSFDLIENQFIYNTFRLNLIAGNIRGFNMLFFILISSIICLLPENNFKRMKKLSIISMFLAALAFMWGILCLGTESTFVYFGF